ncbi:MAG TPA: hypothetical protein VLW50_22835 [Streptosporangiaceae bacterium]|nr:hypothetical protein [Streptosporangiaceae bacterium]
MTLPRSVADVLSDHVVFEVECIDRMYLNLHVPQLQRELGLGAPGAGGALRQGTAQGRRDAAVPGRSRRQ